jgi:hypothetical protein
MSKRTASVKIAGNGTGTRMDPYERQDGVRVVKMQFMVDEELARKERVFSAGLRPPWTRTTFIAEVLRRAMEEWTPDGPPPRKRGRSSDGARE